MDEGHGRVVVFSGGGTGGHLYPALALADALRSLRPDVRAFFVGARRGVEARVLPARGEEHLLLPVLGFARGTVLGNWRMVPALARALGQVAGLFRRLRPELVVVTGGYAGAPAGVMAAVMGVPLALQEANALPGVTTRELSRVARQVHVAFPEAVALLPARARARARVSGNPVRPPEPRDRPQAREAFGLEPSGFVVLVVGGSQGSLALNRVVLEAVAGVQGGSLSRPPGLQLLWSTGPAHLAAVEAGLREAGSPIWVRPVAYIDDMPSALAGADLAVSRAGAMTTSELLAWGIPAVLVPLPTAAADHQARNADTLARAGAAVHLPEAGLTGEALWEEVAGLAADRRRLENMARAARDRGRPDAAVEIARELEQLLPGAAGSASPPAPRSGDEGRTGGTR